MEWYLPVIWAAIIGTAVAMYVILDGFDLGIGILFPYAKSERERDLMMNSVAPFWDGNETWLVLGGARPARRLSPRLRRHHAGVLSAGDLHAARIDVPRRVVRISLGRAISKKILEFRFRRRIDGRRVLSRRDPRRTDLGHRRQRQRNCRRPVRLVHPVRVDVGLRHCRGLCTARRDVACLRTDGEVARRGRSRRKSC